MVVHNANTVVKYWAAKQSFCCNRLEGEDVSAKLKEDISPEIDVYQEDILQSVKSQSQKSWKWWKKARSKSFEKCQEELEKRIKQELEEEDKDT
eukprot:11867832-Ditylum_brightwellii.AAC.1